MYSVVALSGGSDSVALLYVAKKLFENVRAITVDHRWVMEDCLCMNTHSLCCIRCCSMCGNTVRVHFIDYDKKAMMMH